MNFEKLGNIADLIAGQSPPSSSYNKNGIGVPFFQGKADYGVINPTIRNWCSEPTKISLPGDILISVRAPVGPVNINIVESCIGRGLSAIRVKKNISRDYIYFFLKINESKISNLGVGSTFTAITQKDLKEINIPLPAYSDQLHIAYILTKAENLIAKRKESIRLLDEYLKSTFLEMFGDGKIFQWKYIAEIASKEKYSLSSGPFGSNLTSQHYTEKGIIILRGTNITSGKLDLSNVKFISDEKAIELKRSEIKPYDVVIVAVGSSGKALLVPSSLPRAIMSQNFNKITPNRSLINPVYLEFCINNRIVQQQFKKKITDTVRTFLSLTSIKEIKIPVPPLELQTQFAQIVEKTESLKTQYQHSLEELENLYSSLSQRAFRGELSFKDEKYS